MGKEKVFDVSVSWTVGKTVTIKAKSYEEAKKIAEEIPATDGYYVEDSFVIDDIQEKN